MPAGTSGIQKDIVIGGVTWGYWNLRNKGDGTTTCVLDPYRTQDDFTSGFSPTTQYTKVSTPALGTSESTSSPLDNWKLQRVVDNDPDFSGGSVV